MQAAFKDEFIGRKFKVSGAVLEVLPVEDDDNVWVVMEPNWRTQSFWIRAEISTKAMIEKEYNDKIAIIHEKKRNRPWITTRSGFNEMVSLKKSRPANVGERPGAYPDDLADADTRRAVEIKQNAISSALSGAGERLPKHRVYILSNAEVHRNYRSGQNLTTDVMIWRVAGEVTDGERGYVTAHLFGRIVGQPLPSEGYWLE